MGLQLFLNPGVRLFNLFGAIYDLKDQSLTHECSLSHKCVGKFVQVSRLVCSDGP